MSWDTEAIGARQQLETAKKLRELSMQAPQGQMVGNVFVAPHWTQHLAHALRGIDVDRRENEVLNRLESADREKNLATIQAMNAAGLEAPQALLTQAQEKPIQPGMIDRFSAFLRGEEAKPTQPQAIQQNIAKNLTPEQKEAALMQVSFVNPEVGKSLIDHEISKRKLEEANADRDALRQFQADKFASMYGVQPGEMGAIVGGRQILGNGQVVTLPKVGSGSSAGSVSGQSTGGGHGSGSTGRLWSGKVRDGDIVQGFDDQGNPVLFNKITGETHKPEGIQGFGQPKASGGADKPLTEDQAKATGWYALAKNAVAGMEKAKFQQDDQGNLVLDKAGKPIPVDITPGVIETILPQSAETLKNLSRSQPRQLFEHEASVLTEQALRAATGAGLNEGEVRDKIKTLTPQFGDSPAKMAQKTRDLHIYLDTLRLRAGSGAKAYDQATVAPQAPIQGTGSPNHIDELLNKYGGK